MIHPYVSFGSLFRLENCIESLLFEKQLNRDVDHKVFIVYSTGGIYDDEIVHTLQHIYPKAVIIGGICFGGNIIKSVDPGESRIMPDFAKEASKLSVKELKANIKKCTKDKFQFIEKVDIIKKYIELHEKRFNAGDDKSITIEDGIFGIAISGNCPIKSVVSRGVKSVVSGRVALAGDDMSTHKIGQVEKKTQKDGSLVSIVKNIISSEGVPTPAVSFLRNNLQKNPQFLGIRSSKNQGFALLPLEQSMMHHNGLNLKNSHVNVGDDVDLFAVDLQSCILDLDATLSSLKDSLHGTELLGALMFSCGGRGPHAALNTEKMIDAQHFSKVFPSLPLLGFYAGGEIGPDARAGNHNVYQEGEVKLQSFTVVFGVLIVPTRSAMRSKFYNFNDTTEALAKYAHQKLGRV